MKHLKISKKFLVSQKSQSDFSGYEVDKKILKKCKEKGHCVCDPSKTCPCGDFLDNDECICGAYKKI